MNRKVLLIPDDYEPDTSMPATTFLLFSPPPTTTKQLPFHHHHPTTPSSTPLFNSSMVITALIFLAILFFMAFFSFYLRYFSEQSNHPSSSSSTTNTTNNSNPILLRHPQQPRSSNHVVDPTIVLSLPLFSYRGDDATYQTDCAVCLSEFKETETVKVIPYCHHVFHPQCIDRWLYTHVSCPVCRASTAQMLQEGKGCGSTVDNGDTCMVDRRERRRLRIGSCSSSSSDGSRSSLECLGERGLLKRTLSS